MKARSEALHGIADKAFDVCVIGGGATGSGCALDSRLRGLTTVILDAADFAGATSSTSTKIVHGGVRYLEQAVKGLDARQYRVVQRALHERIRMLHNAPYLARPMEFIVPCYRWWDAVYFAAGLKIYDWIARGARLFPSRFLSREETLRRIPSLNPNRLVGSVAYADGQFDDARYNLALIQTFAQAGGEALNYARVIGFERSRDAKLIACEVEDQFTHQRFTVRARAFVNATGPFADTIRQLATPGANPRMRLSKGVHILLPLETMPGDDAILIPKAEDGRVLFAVPWKGRLLVGTTEQEVTIHDELYVTKEEVAYLLRHLNRYLAAPVKPEQVVSGLAGARPLVSSGDSRDTKKLARDHELEVDSQSGLISIMGGKWTTYRAMAEDAVNAVQKHLGLTLTESPTRDHLLIGSEGFTPDYWEKLASDYRIQEPAARYLARKYGTDAAKVIAIVQEHPELAAPIVLDFPAIRAQVIYSARAEMAMTIEDVLFRRLGLQLYSWRSAIHAAPIVGSLLGKELGWSQDDSRAAARDYEAKINRLLMLAGLEQERDSSAAGGLS